MSGNRYNNKISNLEWSTGTEQNNHAYKLKLKLPGIHCNFSKLNEHEVIEIFKSNKTAKELAKIYNISMGNVYMIRRKITWKHILNNL